MSQNAKLPWYATHNGGSGFVWIMSEINLCLGPVVVSDGLHCGGFSVSLSTVVQLVGSVGVTEEFLSLTLTDLRLSRYNLKTQKHTDAHTDATPEQKIPFVY